MRCGIIGQGYVGKALKYTFQNYHHVETYDIAKQSTCQSLEELVSKSKIIFICLPTPMNENGSCCTDIIYDVIKEINELSTHLDKKIIAIKSTIPIGFTEKLQKEFDNIDIFFNPEFLTESNYIEDFKNQSRIIIGGKDKSIAQLKEFYSVLFSDIPIIETTSSVAEMTKYFSNTFLATKVSFANEIKSLCDKLSINYDEVVEYVAYDNRIGSSHFSVPGPDGKMGYGGSCFPKDIASLINQFEYYNLETYILRASWARNRELDRKEHDWEKLHGRAVTKK